MTDGRSAAMRGVKENNKIKVFLGGTVNSTWREEIIPKLKIDYFNPIFLEWTTECQNEELKQRDECDFLLYIITPKQHGVFSIAELVDDSNKRPGRTLFCFLEKDKADEEEHPIKSRSVVLSSSNNVYFSNKQKKSLIAIGNMIERNGARWFKTLDDVVKFLNSYSYDKEKI